MTISLPRGWAWLAPTAAALGWTLTTVLLILILAACETADPAPTASTREALHELGVIDRPAADPSYRRAAFGRAWADVDRDGCNTRDQVLYSTVNKTRPFQTRRQGQCGTDMVAGTWTDLYSGQQMTWTNLKDPSQAERLPLDHIVSLAGAWRYGARDWTPQERLQFANDPLELTPTTATINRSKSDHNAGAWTPPTSGRCDYATRYIAVKTRYQLPVDTAELSALERMLGGCPAGGRPS